jgi:L-ascorbate metabolism protein UlaG (beta-lactamase superfamily)
MKPAFLREEAFLADVRAAPSEPGLLHLWWLGQSGFLLANAGRFLLLDPYLSDSLTRKYAATDLPHARMSEKVVEPDRLGFVSAVCCSHVHTDHLDAETIRPLLAVNPRLAVVIPEAIREPASRRLGVEPARLIGMNDGVSRHVEGFLIHGIPSAHNELDTDEEGRHRFLGYVVQAGPWRVYHSGDTRLYDGLAGRLAAFDLDVGLLPINGWSPRLRVAGNLSIEEAVSLGIEAGIRLVVPHHFDMFEFNTADPEAFRAAAGQRRLTVNVLRPGERLTLTPG